MWLPMPSECEPFAFLLHSGGSSSRSRSTRGGTRGRTPRAPLLMAKGGASDTMDRGVFFFAERSTTLERSVRSVTTRPGAVSGLMNIT